MNLRIWLCAGGGLFFLLPAFTEIPETTPSWWEIRIQLTTCGTYEWKEIQKSYKGKYAFEIHWAGLMERDGDDFIVYSDKANLKKWDARETAVRTDSVSTLSTCDFGAKPAFDFHYILCEDQTLQLEFQVIGFTVPRHESKRKIELNLPVTRESADTLTTIEYNPHISKGSNVIRLKRKAIEKAAVQETFTWTWAFKKWLELQEITVSLDHRHEVQVKIEIAPQVKKKQSR